MTSVPPTDTIYFWKPDHPEFGWLSQWYVSYCLPPGQHHHFRTAEQWMMHQKAILFNDEESASKILQTDDPKTCQELGRQVKNYNASIWNENKLNIVTEGSYHKFAHSTLQNDDLKSKLLATGNRPLVEASPVDRVWGVGFGAQDAEDNRAEWGENLLGIALEAARQRIRTESQESQ